MVWREFFVKTPDNNQMEMEQYAINNFTIVRRTTFLTNLLDSEITKVFGKPDFNVTATEAAMRSTLWRLLSARYPDMRQIDASMHIENAITRARYPSKHDIATQALRNTTTAQILTTARNEGELLINPTPSYGHQVMHSVRRFLLDEEESDSDVIRKAIGNVTIADLTEVDELDEIHEIRQLVDPHGTPMIGEGFNAPLDHEDDNLNGDIN